MNDPHHKNFDPGMYFFLDNTMDPRALESPPSSATPDLTTTNPPYAHTDSSYTPPTMPLNGFGAQSPILGAFFGTSLDAPALPPRHLTTMGAQLPQFSPQSYEQDSRLVFSSWDTDFAQSFDPLMNIYQTDSSIGQELLFGQRLPAFESAAFAQQNFQAQIQANSPSSFMSMQCGGIPQQVAHALGHLDNPIQLNRNQQKHHANKDRVRKQKRTNNTVTVKNSPIFRQLQAAHGGFAHQNSARLDIDAHAEGTPFSQSNISQSYSHPPSGSPNLETLGRVEEPIAQFTRARQSLGPATLAPKPLSLDTAIEEVSLNRNPTNAVAIAPPRRGHPRNPSPPVATLIEQTSQNAIAATVEGVDKATGQIAYVSTYEMQFSGFSDAKIHYNQARWRPAYPDATVPTENSDITALARRVMLAMNNIKGAKDHGSSAYKHWLRDMYPTRDTEAVAFEIVHEAYRLHTLGSTLRVYSFKKMLPEDIVGKTEEEIDESVRSKFADEGLNFEERMNAVVDHLMHWKSTCDYAMTGEKISWLVNAPLKYDHKVATNQRGNRSRALRNRAQNPPPGTPLTGADDGATPLVIEKRKRGTKRKKAANGDGLSTPVTKATPSCGPKRQKRKARTHVLASVETLSLDAETTTPSTRQLRDRSMLSTKPKYADESSDNDEEKPREALLRELNGDQNAFTNRTKSNKAYDEDSDASRFKPDDTGEDEDDDEFSEAPRSKKQRR